MDVIAVSHTMVLIVLIMLMIVACGIYADVNASSTKSVSKRHVVLPDTRIGLVIPFEHNSEHPSEGHGIDYSNISPIYGPH